MTDTHRPGRHPIDVELQIDQVDIMDPTEATATVRCLRGPVRCGARFGQIRDSAEVVDLKLTRIHAYGRPVEELDLAHTTLVTLRGTGSTSHGRHVSLRLAGPSGNQPVAAVTKPSTGIDNCSQAPTARSRASPSTAPSTRPIVGSDGLRRHLRQVAPDPGAAVQRTQFHQHGGGEDAAAGTGRWKHP
jgi:hypothetical protein